MADQQFDIIISGGGLTGLTLGIGLAAAGFDVGVVDMADPATVQGAEFDGRASAISYASHQLLTSLGIWQHTGDHASVIEDIRISDGDSLLHLHFDHRDLGQGPLGHMLENRHNRQALFKRLESLPNLTLFAPNKITNHKSDDTAVTVTLDDGTTLGSALLVGAEGRFSPTRQRAGIKTTDWRYPQVGLVTTLQHEHPHCNIAHERFLPDGPFALLPLPNNRSSVVWTVRSEQRDIIMNLPERAFVAELQKRVGGFLGELETIGPRFDYPLGLMLAERYSDQRMVLVGDAAHGMHPIAGQGVNLGYRDVAVLIEVLIKARQNSQGLGGADVLEKYEQWRRVDNVTLLTVTDLLNRLFSNDITMVKTARDLGLAMVEKMPPVKKFFMSHARGTVGTLPKLLTGTTLADL